MSLHPKAGACLRRVLRYAACETHAILLPYTTAFNEAAVPDALAPIAEAFGGGSAGGGLWDFAREVGSPLSLKEVGIAEADLDRAAALAVENRYSNPRDFSRDDIRALLQQAWDGSRPGA